MGIPRLVLPTVGGMRNKISDSFCVAGSRIELRSLSDTEASAVPWSRELRDGESVQRLAIVRLQDQALIGGLAFRILSGRLIVDSIVISRDSRAWGYGSEAVQLLEGEVVRMNLAKQFMSDVTRQHGRCLYFWLRLGYRPLPEGGKMKMVRVVQKGDLHSRVAKEE